MIGLSFNSNDLQTVNIITTLIDHADIPVKEARMYALSHSNKSIIASVNYPSRSISVVGRLKAVDKSALDTLLDTFKAYFVGADKNLDIDYAGGTRRYIATVNKLAINQGRGLSFADFQIEFICSQPFGRNTTTNTILSSAGRTLNNYTDPYTFLNSSPYNLPQITYTLNSVTDGTLKNVIFGNSSTGQEITINRTWAASEVLVIDCQEKIVTLDDIEIEFNGAFPEFEAAAQNLYYSDTFTARDFDIDVVYYPMWL
jgi:hypothetical protein